MILPTSNGHPVKRKNYATEVNQARESKQDKQTRNRYSDEHKSEALALAARVGITSAMKQSGLNESQFYAWRGKAKREETEGESQRQLSAENVRLKRQLAEKEGELATLKKRRRTSRSTRGDVRLHGTACPGFCIAPMCRVLIVSRRGFCAWRQRQACPGPGSSGAWRLDRQVVVAFAARKGRCGSPTLTCDLRDQGLPYDRETVAASQQRQSPCGPRPPASSRPRRTRAIASRWRRTGFNRTSARLKTRWRCRRCD